MVRDGEVCVNYFYKYEPGLQVTYWDTNDFLRRGIIEKVDKDGDGWVYLVTVSGGIPNRVAHKDIWLTKNV